MNAVLIAGFATGIGLIVAIGAQNAFVLRQGLSRQYVAMVASICTAADVLLIAAGVGGLGGLIQRHLTLLEVVRVLGVAYLGVMAIRSFWRATRNEQLLPSEGTPQSRLSVVLAVLGFTFLNPHVYLDTVLLLGAIGATYGKHRWWFALGASLASFSWFFGLAFGARSLGRFMSKPIAWRVLDIVIGFIMISVAIAVALTPLR